MPRIAPLVILIAALCAASCAPAEAVKPVELPRSARPQAPQIFRFRVGTLDAVALKDGDLHAVNDAKTFGVGQSTAGIGAVLAGAGLSTTTIDLSMQPLVVRDGARTLLFDSGAAGVSFAPEGGHLPEALQSAGIDPAAVTDIFLSHGHPDHVGGLTTRAGALAFPNAAIHLSAPEWEAIKTNPEQSALSASMAPRVKTFAPGAVILPEVRSVEVVGHTPGHSAYSIGSGDDRLLYIGDAAHHSVLSVERPDWTIAYDANEPVARASRRALLQRAADENLRIYAVHFPFPGIGHVRARGDAFVWVPETK